MTKPKIVLLDAATLGDVANLDIIEKLGNLTCHDMTASNETITRLQNADIVITNKVIINKEVMDACPQLKLVCIAATGMNNVDLDYAVQKGISVKNVAGYSTQSVTQHAFSMLFHLMHHNTYFDNYVKSGEYCKSPLFTFLSRSFFELNGKRFGIIGLGNIGRSVANVAAAFGAEVCYYSTSGKNNNTQYKQLELNELLSSCDVVSIHCPLNEQTNNLIDENELKLMQPHAYLLNTGRGGIVNELALAKAIDNNVLAGAGVDVLTKEPIAVDNPLLSVKNKEKLFITPHIAWASREARATLVEGIAKNIKEWMGN